MFFTKENGKFLKIIWLTIFPRTDWFRSSHQRCSIKNDIFKNFEKFTGKHLRRSFFFNKVAGLIRKPLSKKSLQYRCFPVNFARFLCTDFLKNTTGQLLLIVFRRLREIVFEECKWEKESKTSLWLHQHSRSKLLQDEID